MSSSGAYEAERERLIRLISENLGRTLTSFNTLNRSVEAVTLVGNQFESVTTLWQQFEDTMAHPLADDATKMPVEQPNLKSSIRSQSQTDLTLPTGVAPGGGERYLS
ncbi:uncharacterized protein L969DRAFT_23770 [Mixia osmundae IAM 14324]|uniref:DASH complex subunit DAD1 n=1 Tax=Mixia osmundae (strain CBS 9802 / IAM 14324 / JCM 22182 / KY 12970) TaxID=764103 RepID=G7E3C7_MIXOS|nr:uncharacterized protein L969DRAFT_23770 [Mixia osmundae IAM 14324]KEI39323.1 hypothetical protein L969DRAFT_23770 [Mixia osmundae IAM 14324]GAA97337.1 hypothetical protein E5Q_04015 [Mixia osmundae IAM 14324]